MKDKRRSVNTRFWDDPFVEDLNPNEKLLFLYLLTNPLTNLLGIYEITVKRIAYDTGLKTDTIRNGLEGFEKVKKAFFVDNYIVLPNWLKNQQLNTNMKVAVVKEFNDLPNRIKDSILGNGSKGLGNDTKGFRMIMERLDKYEREIESEIEGEGEISFDAIMKYYNDNCGKLPKIESMTDARKKLINARYKDYGKESIAKVIKAAAASDFLTGGNDKKWTANFDWIFNPNNFVKILEGNYGNKADKQTKGSWDNDIYTRP